MGKDEIKEKVKEGYGKIAKKGGCCCGSDCSDVNENIGYSEEELQEAPEANLGLGCGNPTSLAKIEEGSTVLDLGSGAGFDCFLAARKVGEKGKVIGVDLTQEMVAKARENAKDHGYNNVEFRLGDIENLPVESESIDYIISNCVINLAPDKPRVFNETHRVLNEGGKLLISDIVLLQELSADQKEDEDLLISCVAGAVLKERYLNMLKDAGFEVNLISEDSFLKNELGDLPIESIKLEAIKR